MNPDEQNNHDDLIDLSRPSPEPTKGNDHKSIPSSVDRTSPRAGHDPFAPPPPKAKIFHTDDSVPHQTGNDLWADAGDTLGQTRMEEKYHFELPTKSQPYPALWKFINHPVVKVITIVVLVVGLLGSRSFSPMWWLALFAFIFVIPYWLINRSKWQRDYNPEWEADAEPTGCLYPSYRHWWWWP